MSKHTKGKWEVMDEYFVACNSGVIAKTYLGVPASKKVEAKWKANADFIVRACNSHDELLEACKKAISTFKNDSHYGDKFFNGENSTIRYLELAISKAENTK